MKKNVLLVSSLLTVCSMVLTILFTLNGELVTNADDDIIWYHYAAVEPTNTNHGSKEFWANSSDNCGSHTLNNPGVECEDRDFSSNELFTSLSTEDDRFIPSLNQQLGVEPCYYPTANIVTYGSYPQTVVTDEVLISSLNKLSMTNVLGYYEHNGHQYEKLTATPCRTNYKFDNGETIVSGKTYYFKVEPVVWRCFSVDGGEAFLASECLLDHQIYHEKSNNYKSSTIREWLNSNFLEKTFADVSLITITSVDNSPDSTYSGVNDFACEPTYDKIFLLCRRDMVKTDYGFSPNPFAGDEARKCITTDYTRAKGAYCPSNDGYSTYWLRSPTTSLSDHVYNVYDDGFLDYYYVGTTSGVRPCLNLKIS